MSATFSVPAGAPPATAIAFDLQVPSGWSATPTSPTTVGVLKGGGSATATWQVTAPVGNLPTASLLTATVGYQQRSESESLNDTRVARAAVAADDQQLRE